MLWTKSALAALYDIYHYYKVNVSITIARKIRDNIFSASNQLEKHSNTGQIEELLKEKNGVYRYFIKDKYKIIYKIQKNKVYITDVFDTRQSPHKIITRNV